MKFVLFYLLSKSLKGSTLSSFECNDVYSLGLVWEEGMEWKRMKIIILEYSSLLLFESFN